MGGEGREWTRSGSGACAPTWDRLTQGQVREPRRKLRELATRREVLVRIDRRAERFERCVHSATGGGGGRRDALGRDAHRIAAAALQTLPADLLGDDRNRAGLR
jgi:hypothetical protein